MSQYGFGREKTPEEIELANKRAEELRAMAAAEYASKEKYNAQMTQLRDEAIRISETVLAILRDFQSANSISGEIKNFQSSWRIETMRYSGGGEGMAPIGTTGGIRRWTYTGSTNKSQNEYVEVRLTYRDDVLVLAVGATWPRDVPRTEKEKLLQVLREQTGLDVS